MSKRLDNPATNKFASGITEEQVADAVRKSGYPLQTLIANSLRDMFQVEEEWSFIDREANILRTTDIRAMRRLSRSETSGKRIRPVINVLIECKQSDLPYVFFMSKDKSAIKSFPMFAGLHKDEISVVEGKLSGTWSFSVISALGLHKHEFLEEPERCMSFSKCVRKGKGLELSGADVFQNLILPLVKALQHFKEQAKPPKTFHYHDCHLVTAVGLLDAPMMAARVEEEKSLLNFIPWVRVVRNEAVEADHPFERTQSFAIDVVHKDFFASYLERLLPFADEFATLALKHDVELADGQGYGEGMSNRRGRNVVIEPDLKPRSHLA